MFCPFFNYENKVAKLLISNNQTVSTAESCTGGLVSSLLTDVSGSSNFILSNFVTYSNDAKEKYLFVKKYTLSEYGAVSEQTAREMAEGLIKQSYTDFALSVTGIAGPTGGTKEKPVGLAYLGICNKNKTVVKKLILPKFLPRRFMKFCFAKMALYYLIEFMKGNIND